MVGMLNVEEEVISEVNAHVEKVCENSHEDVKKRKKKGNGVKKAVHTLNDNLSRPMTRSTKQK